TDWWFAVRAALVSEVAYVAEPRTLYRFHGGNLTLGVTGAAKERELRKAMTLVRWFLPRIPDDASARGLAAAWHFYEHCARDVREWTGDPIAPFVDVTDADRAQSRAALAEGDVVRAAAADPTCSAARDALAEALVAGPGPHRALAFAEELVDRPALLAAWTA